LDTTINDNDQLQSADQYRQMIVAYKSGDAVRLSDVATVVEGPENRELAAWVNRTPAIILNIQRQPGSNVIAVVNAVEATLPKLEKSLPAGRTTVNCPADPGGRGWPATAYNPDTQTLFLFVNTAVRSIAEQIQLLIAYHTCGTVGRLEDHRFYRSFFEYCH
jgi:hypothetical protein